MIDEEGKVLLKISIVDIFIVAVALAMMIGIYVRFNSNFAEKKETSVKIEYVLKSSDVRESKVDAFKRSKNLNLYDGKTKENIGQIIEVEAMPATTYKDMDDGSIEKLEIPEKYDMIITVKSDAKSNVSGYKIGDKTISIGDNLNAKTKFALTGCDVVNIIKCD
jgi:hypothetical protein